MLLLALADAHIPERAIDLPMKFKKLLDVPNKISQVVLLGNCTKSYSLLNFVDGISSNVSIVRGEFDSIRLPSVKKVNRENEEIPINVVLEVGDIKIGCCSGYAVVPKNDPLSLLALARQLDVDILLWGGTHNVEAYTLENKFFVNPGSCTGAFNADWPIYQPEMPGTDIVEETKETDGKETKDVDTQTDKTEIETASGEMGTKNNENSSKEEVKNKKIEIDLSQIDTDGANIPSFCLLDIQGKVTTLYIYLYIDGEVKIDKVVYTKD